MAEEELVKDSIFDHYDPGYHDYTPSYCYYEVKDGPKGVFILNAIEITGDGQEIILYGTNKYIKQTLRLNKEDSLYFCPL